MGVGVDGSRVLGSPPSPPAAPSSGRSADACSVPVLCCAVGNPPFHFHFHSRKQEGADLFIFPFPFHTVASCQRLP
eukprot:scaffold3639_cov141-Isochrysis_galbana.AAC.13